MSVDGLVKADFIRFVELGWRGQIFDTSWVLVFCH
jgi:hypothetical protein